MNETPAASDSPLVRRIGLFDTTMLVMGGIIGSGIFVNPSVVARQVHSRALILGAWALGGVVALAGALVYAELAALRPGLGGQYAYLRDAYHSSVAFLYGWALLLIMQTGGMAAVAVIFARYSKEILRTGLSDSSVAVATLLLLSAVNCLGVRSGSTVQSALMLLKIGAIGFLVVAGFAAPATHAVDVPLSPSHGFPILAFGAAVVPVLFSYGGWQTTSFVTGEMLNPRRDLSRALLFGVAGVAAIYLSINAVCLRALGSAGLAQTTTPAYSVMRQAIGSGGAVFMALAISISALGFLSQGMLTAPRVYFAMASDGVFFRSLTWVPQRSRVPVAAIALQGLLASVIAVSGRYEQILNYVVSIDFIFMGLTGATLFVFRRKMPPSPEHRTPGHPFTTIFFVAACWLTVLATFYHYPQNSFTGLGLLLLGVPVYLYWSRKRNRASA